MVKLWQVTCVLAALFIGGCSGHYNMPDFLIPHALEKTARQYAEDFRAGNFTPLAAAWDRARFGPLPPHSLSEWHQVVPKENPASVKLVGSRTVSNAGVTTASLTYEYQFSQKWLLVEVVVTAASGHTTLEGFHLEQMTQSLEQQTAFTLARKGWPQYLMLMAAILVLATILFTAIVCVRTPIGKRKWAWLVFVLLGIVTVTVNWSTGQLVWKPLSFNLLGVSMTAVSYGPWMLQVGFPLGAVVFWSVRGRLLRKAKAAVAAG